jgi:hypothetical protein
MTARRQLIEGLKTLDPNIDVEQAEEFISGGKNPKPERQAPHRPQTTSQAAEETPAPKPPLPASVLAAAQVAPSSPLTGVGRVPVGARVRTELAASLKRASLERQLQGIQPNSVQDILEDAIELWLHKHGLLK